MKNIVYYDLKKSCYIEEIGHFKFYFSSLFHLNKFKNKLKNEMEKRNCYFKKRYEFTLNSVEYFAYKLYKKIESRGFYVFYENKEITSNETFKLNFSCLEMIENGNKI